MLRENKHFTTYSCRIYAVRGIRHGFRENKKPWNSSLTGPHWQLYLTDQFIIENQEKPRT
ncbi:unnamed protein product [Nyctereutes procyonoides]|uniref:(raccoon dog) hypothetical protein n=1 Tax=Nyctereutes procyonoides TaxID=34880 RepID=A0A811Z0H2_NYCPR|nr:unnamed protein product [Nyctereutes procyonoides]